MHVSVTKRDRERSETSDEDKDTDRQNDLRWRKHIILDTGRCLFWGLIPFSFTHTYTHKSSLIRRVVLLRNVSVNQEVLAWMSCNPLIRHPSQFLVPHPFIPTDHHSHDTLPTSHWTCVCVCGTECMFVSVTDRKAAVFRLTSVVLLATNRMMIEMKLIRADNKEETSSRPCTHCERHQRGQMAMNVTKDDSYPENRCPRVQSLI